MEKFSSNPDVVKFDIDESIFDEMFKDTNTVSNLEKIADKLDSV
jgi:hypothetical protein